MEICFGWNSRPGDPDIDSSNEVRRAVAVLPEQQGIGQAVLEVVCGASILCKHCVGFAP